MAIHAPPSCDTFLADLCSPLTSDEQITGEMMSLLASMSSLYPGELPSAVTSACPAESDASASDLSSSSSTPLVEEKGPAVLSQEPPPPSLEIVLRSAAVQGLLAQAKAEGAPCRSASRELVARLEATGNQEADSASLHVLLLMEVCDVHWTFWASWDRESRALDRLACLAYALCAMANGDPGRLYHGLTVAHRIAFSLAFHAPPSLRAFRPIVDLFERDRRVADVSRDFLGGLLDPCALFASNGPYWVEYLRQEDIRLQVACFSKPLLEGRGMPRKYGSIFLAKLLNAPYNPFEPYVRRYP